MAAKRYTICCTICGWRGFEEQLHHTYDNGEEWSCPLCGNPAWEYDPSPSQKESAAGQKPAHRDANQRYGGLR